LAAAPFVTQAFSPVISHPPGTLVARVLIAPKSLPASGSLRDGAQISEPFNQSWQIARNLLGCSFTLNSGNGSLHVDQRESARKARARDRLGDGDLREEARSRAATLGRNLHAIQPQADPFRNNARRERGFLSLQPLGYRGDHVVRKSLRDSDK